MKILTFIITLLVAVAAAKADGTNTLGDGGAKDTFREMIKVYEQDPNWRDECLLPFAISYAMEHQNEKAEELYRRYLRVTPNSTSATRGLGNVLLLQGKGDEAIKQFQKGWEAGDVNYLQQLAFSYIGLRRFDDLKLLIPTLIQHKKDDMLIVYYLVIYSINVSPSDKKVFAEAVEGCSDLDLTRDKDTVNAYIKGFETFGDTARAEKLRSLSKTEKKE